MPIFQGQPHFLEAFRRGERWAIERVYREHVRMLDGYLRALARAARAREVAHDGLIADWLQEIFIRAFSPGARSAYDGSRPYAPYLRRIAKNLFIDQLRARGRALEHCCLSALPDVTHQRRRDDFWGDGRQARSRCCSREWQSDGRSKTSSKHAGACWQRAVAG